MITHPTSLPGHSIHPINKNNYKTKPMRKKLVKVTLWKMKMEVPVKVPVFQWYQW